MNRICAPRLEFWPIPILFFEGTMGKPFVYFDSTDTATSNCRGNDSGWSPSPASIREAKPSQKERQEDGVRRAQRYELLGIPWMKKTDRCPLVDPMKLTGFLNEPTSKLDTGFFTTWFITTSCPAPKTEGSGELRPCWFDIHVDSKSAIYLAPEEILQNQGFTFLVKHFIIIA